MKKTTAFFLSIGVIAMIAGGVGSMFYYQNVQDSIKNSHEEYQVKNKEALQELHLNLSGDSSYIINSEDTDLISLSANSVVNATVNGTLKVTEDKNKVTANVTTSTEQLDNGITFFNIGIFSEYHSPNMITIPSSVKKLFIEGDTASNVSINSLKVDELTTNLKRAYTEISALSADKLSITTTSGTIFMGSENSASKATIKSTDGDINLSNFSFDSLEVATTRGDLSLAQGRGTVTGSTTDGDITVDGLKGDATFTSKNGDFSLNTPDVPNKLEVNLEHGDISVYANEILRDITIKGHAKLGDVEMLGEERRTYKNGSDNHQFDLTSAFGDITVEAPYGSE